jgi:hypothetical protein
MSSERKADLHLEVAHILLARDDFATYVRQNCVIISVFALDIWNKSKL